MIHNPYSPPSAVVDDVSAPLSMERPRFVVLGVRLLWLSLVIGIPSAIYRLVTTSYAMMSKSSQVMITLGSWAVGFLIFYWLITSVWKGKNWARIVQLVFIVLGLLFSVWAVPAVFRVGMLAGITYVVQTALNLAAVTLFFLPISNAWFRAIRNQ